MVDVIIVGAGVAGLACSLSLSLHNIAHRLYEKRSRAGGLLRSFEVDGFRFDLGPHVLLNIAPAAIGDIFARTKIELKDCRCNSSIWLGDGINRHVPAPIQGNLAHLPLALRVACLAGYLNACLTFRGAGQTYEQAAIGRLGRPLVELFMAPYDRKRLSQSLADLSAEYCARLPRIVLSQLARGLAGFKNGKGNGGLDSHFKYPAEGGIDQLPAAMTNLIPEHVLELSRAVTAIDVPARTAKLGDGSKVSFRHLASTMPLNELIGLCSGVPGEIRKKAERLRSVGTVLVNLGYKGQLNGPKGIIRYPSASFCFYRLSFPGSYASGSSPMDSESVVAEVGESAGIPEMSDEQIVARVHDGIVRAGIANRDQAILASRVQRLNVNHPLRLPGTSRDVGEVRAWLQSCGIWSCGKFGEWREFLIPEAMLSGYRTGQAIGEALAQQQAAGG